MRFAVVTDSTCDLGGDILKKYDIEYAHMNYVVDEKSYPAMYDMKDPNPHEFYDLMRNGKRIKTTQVAQETFKEVFGSILETDRDILYLACSSALSSSVNTAMVIAKELSEKYPDRKICCVDCLISSLGQGHLAVQAAKMRDNGLQIDEIVRIIDETKLYVHQFATVDDLNYLKRAGRVKAQSAFFGNAFGIRPILVSDRKGQNVALKKVKGSRNARLEIARMVAETADESEKQTLYISHADAEEDAKKLRDEILALAPFADCYINYIAPIVGASVGPGSLIAYCCGKEQKPDLQ